MDFVIMEAERPKGREKMESDFFHILSIILFILLKKFYLNIFML